MKLYAISDLHLANEANRQALDTLQPYPEDWVILAGDIGETEAHLHLALTTFRQKFKQIIWVPGNHDLWTVPNTAETFRGVKKYARLVEVCRSYGVHTPEDSFPVWPGQTQSYQLAPLFTLYDYSYRPESIPLEHAVRWAEETNVVCTDEYLLHPDPYPSRIAWCEARCAYSEQRLAQLEPNLPVILINHFPLRQDLVRLKYIPRFSLWCGTKQTNDWHIRYNAKVVVYGHLHIPRTDWRNGVRFEEVSFGYPKQRHTHNLNDYLRVIISD